MKVAVHDDADALIDARVQLAPTLPGPPVVNPIVPPGEDAEPPDCVSVTVAVIVDVAPPAVMLVGLDDTAVAVDLVPTVTDPEPELVA